MLIDGRLFCRPRELVVYSFKPYTKPLNSDSHHVQEPEIILHYRQYEVKLTGRTLMWDLLDAAHPKDPLPRIPVNNDLFHVIEGNDPLHIIFNDLLNEGSSDYIELGLVEYRGEHVVVSAKASNTGVPDTALRGVWDAVDRGQWEHYFGVLPYVDRSGPHQRDVLIIDSHPTRILVYDLGNKLCVMGMVIANGVDYRPLAATTIGKGEDYFYTVAKGIVEKYMLTLSLAAKHIEGMTLSDSAKTPKLRTYEADLIGHERWLRLGVTL